MLATRVNKIIYTLGEKKEERAGEPQFRLVAPYSTYLKEQKDLFKNDQKNVEKWLYLEEVDCFICSN